MRHATACKTQHTSLPIPKSLLAEPAGQQYVQGQRRQRADLITTQQQHAARGNSDGVQHNKAEQRIVQYQQCSSTSNSRRSLLIAVGLCCAPAGFLPTTAHAADAPAPSTSGSGSGSGNNNISSSGSISSPGSSSLGTGAASASASASAGGESSEQQPQPDDVASEEVVDSDAAAASDEDDDSSSSSSSSSDEEEGEEDSSSSDEEEPGELYASSSSGSDDNNNNAAGGGSNSASSNSASSSRTQTADSSSSAPSPSSTSTTTTSSSSGSNASSSRATSSSAAAPSSSPGSRSVVASNLSVPAYLQILQDSRRSSWPLLAQKIREGEWIQLSQLLVQPPFDAVRQACFNIPWALLQYDDYAAAVESRKAYVDYIDHVHALAAIALKAADGVPGADVQVQQAFTLMSASLNAFLAAVPLKYQR